MLTVANHTNFTDKFIISYYNNENNFEKIVRDLLNGQWLYLTKSENVIEHFHMIILPKIREDNIWEQEKLYFCSKNDNDYVFMMKSKSLQMGAECGPPRDIPSEIWNEKMMDYSNFIKLFNKITIYKQRFNKQELYDYYLLGLKTGVISFHIAPDVTNPYMSRIPFLFKPLK